MARDYLRQGTLCKCKKKLWKNPNQVVRIAKRKLVSTWAGIYKYFVVAVGDPTGYGATVDRSDLIALTPLEQLALQAEEIEIDVT